MSDLLLLIPENLDRAWLWMSKDGSGCAYSTEEKNNLSEIERSRTIAVLSGTQVNTKLHTLGRLNPKQKQLAAGFSIEDDLAAPLTETHIAFDTGGTRLAMIANTAMQDVLSSLEAANLSPDIICADYDAIAGDQMLSYQGRILQSFGTGLGYAIEEDWAGYVLDEGQSIPTPSSDKSVLAQIQQCLANGHSPINLRQGIYAKRVSLAPARIKRIAILVAACLLAFIGLNIGQGQAYSQKNKTVRMEMVQIYEAIFPGKNMPKNPTISVLRAQSDRKSQTGDAFIHLSKILAGSLKQLEGVELVSLNYDEGQKQLSLSVLYNSFDDVERLKNTVTQNGGTFTENGTRQEGRKLAGNAMLRGTP